MMMNLGIEKEEAANNMCATVGKNRELLIKNDEWNGVKTVEMNTLYFWLDIEFEGFLFQPGENGSFFC